MHNPGTSSSAQAYQNSFLTRVSNSIQMYATPANLVGLAGGLVAIFCMIALPTPLSMHVLLYLVLAVWILLRPRVALYLLAIAIPWGTLDTLHSKQINVDSADLLVLLLAVSWLMSFALRHFSTQQRIGSLDRDNTAISYFLTFAILAYIFTMLLSLPGATDLRISVKEISKWLELLIVVFIGPQYIRTRRQIWTLLLFMCLAALSQSLLGYLQGMLDLGPQSFIRNSALRVYGTFDQPNPYAGYINMTLSITMALTLLGKSVPIRLLAGIMTIVQGIALALSQSRGGETALVAMLLLIVLLGMPQLRLALKVAVLAMLIFVAAYLAGLLPAALSDPILEKLGLAGISFVMPTPDDFATAERLAHWIAGVRMFVAHPLFGVGIGNYGAAYHNYYVTIFLDPLGHAHNYYINIAAEAGIFGLAGLIILLTAIFVTGSQAYKNICNNIKIAQTHLATQVQQVNAVLHAKKDIAGRLRILSDDRALAIGLLASLLSVCVHNLVDNVFVHSMTSLFALLIVMLIRLGALALGASHNGGHFE